MAVENLTLKSDIESEESLNFYSIPGMVTLFAGDTVPEGWLFCDGSQFLESEYPLLYDALGSLFLPNLQENYLISGISNEVDYQVGSKSHMHTYKYTVAAGTVTQDPNTGNTHNMNYNYYGATQVNAGGLHYHNYGSDYYANSGVALVGRGNGNNQSNLISNHRHRAASIYGANFNGTTGVAALNYSTWTYDFGDLKTHNHNISMGGAPTNTTYAHQHSITSLNDFQTTIVAEDTPRTMYFKYIIKAG